MDKQSQIEELSLEICQYLIPEAYQKDTPPKVRAEDIASHLLNRGYVKKGVRMDIKERQEKLLKTTKRLKLFEGQVLKYRTKPHS